jgi:hypothetical protein
MRDVCSKIYLSLMVNVVIACSGKTMYSNPALSDTLGEWPVLIS